MKSAISWNDMNDQSSLSGCSSDEEIANIMKNKKLNQEEDTLILQKTVSSPEQTLKSLSQTNVKITENLEKLLKHSQPKVWLYAMDSNINRQPEVSQILNSIPDFEKILPLAKGWNVLVKTEIAAKYLEKGHYQRGINLKFIYSNKNEQKQGKKSDKKYNEKNKNTGSVDEYEEIRSPRMKQKVTYTEKSAYQKEKQFGDGGQKKKTKYVAKETMKKEEEKAIEKKSQPSKKIHEEVGEESSSPQKREEFNNPNKNEDEEKNNTQTQSIERAEKEEPTQKEVLNHKQAQKVVQNSAKIQVRQTNADEENAKEIEEQNKEQQTVKQEKVAQKQENSGSEQEAPKQVKVEKKKKKKKDKRGGFNDPNNPFSRLMN